MTEPYVVEPHPNRPKEPHRWAERALMDQGKKLAYLLPDQERNLPLFEPEKFVVKPHLRGDTTRWLIYRPQDVHLADVFLKAYDDCDAGRITTAEAHAIIGTALGYTADQVAWFVRMHGPDPLI